MNKKFLYFFVFLFIILFVFGGFLIGNKKEKTVFQIHENKSLAEVVWVVDGDTIKVLINNKENVVRLIGIDSPEVLDERKPAQCFGKEASNKAKEILNGKTVSLESDSTQNDRDEYGRLLRYVFLNDLNFNKFMISEGYAYEYTFKGNSYKYQSEFIQAEKKAQGDRKGLWADGACD